MVAPLVQKTTGAYTELISIGPGLVQIQLSALGLTAAQIKITTGHLVLGTALHHRSD